MAHFVTIMIMLLTISMMIVLMMWAKSWVTLTLASGQVLACSTAPWVEGMGWTLGLWALKPSQGCGAVEHLQPSLGIYVGLRVRPAYTSTLRSYQAQIVKTSCFGFHCPLVILFLGCFPRLWHWTPLLKVSLAGRILRTRVESGQEKAMAVLTLLCKSAPSMANDTIAVFSNWVIGAFRALVLLFI